jgi:molybdenum transport protein
VTPVNDLTLTIAELEALLAEDAPHGDLTTSGLGISARPAMMRFSARGDMVVAGIGIAEGLIRVAGGAIRLIAADGDRVAAGGELLVATGSAGALHRAWKQAQTVMEILSGIAGAASAVVAAAVAPDGRRIPVACTRKTLAGARRLQMGAVRAGGAVAHRLGLSETVLVFAEHRAFLADVAPRDAVARLRAAAPEKKLVTEVATPDEAIAAADAGWDVLQLEKFAPAAVAEVVARLAGRPIRPVVAAAGGIHPDNAGAYAAAGADVIVTSWPYTARPSDVQVHIAPAA